MPGGGRSPPQLPLDRTQPPYHHPRQRVHCLVRRWVGACPLPCDLEGPAPRRVTWGSAHCAGERLSRFWPVCTLGRQDPRPETGSLLKLQSLAPQGRHSRCLLRPSLDPGSPRTEALLREALLDLLSQRAHAPLSSPPRPFSLLPVVSCNTVCWCAPAWLPDAALSNVGPGKAAGPASEWLPSAEGEQTRWHRLRSTVVLWSRARSPRVGAGAGRGCSWTDGTEGSRA